MGAKAQIVVGALAVAFAAGAQGSINYGNFNGTDVTFLNVTEDSITDALPLFGAPTPAGNSLLFFPTAYASSSANGTADTTSGTLTMTLVAKPGTFLKKIKITELGDYALAGIGTAATSAQVSGLLTGTDLFNGNVYFDTLHVAPKPKFTLPGDSTGPWNGVTEVDVTGLGITMMAIVFNNTLQTTSESGTTSFIQKKVISGPSIKIDVPAPGAVSLLGIAGLTIVRRRR